MRKIYLFIAALCCATMLQASQGALPGGFTINAQGDKVQFSKGNLQYQASTGTWRFADNQYDLIVTDDSNISASYSGSYSGWIDLFGWGTGSNPTNASTSDSDYSTFVDWGVNAISNGGNKANLWRTLTIDEWGYLFSTRANAASKYGQATVAGVYGIILLPDVYGGAAINTSHSAWDNNTISAADWVAYEAYGAVFLPAAGYRRGTDVSYVGKGGFYWSSTPFDADSRGHLVSFYSNTLSLGGIWRCTGRSVRLVQTDKEQEPLPEPKALPGRFSVSANEWVTFAQSNLRYKASAGTWCFSENQYDMIGADNTNIAETYDGWIDLFGWGTSGYNGKDPWMTIDGEGQYGNGANDIANTSYDWGGYANIRNGGGKEWRTLTANEWTYLLQTRANAADKYGNATVAGEKGLVLLPNTWQLPAGLSFTAAPANWTTNAYSAEQWNQMEANGAVFLPASARRDVTTIMSIDADVRRGYYWTSSADGAGRAKAVRFEEEVTPYLYTDYRFFGYAVRLVSNTWPEAIEQVQGDKVQGTKILRDGQLLILRNGRTYTATGAEVK